MCIFAPSITSTVIWIFALRAVLNTALLVVDLMVPKSDWLIARVHWIKLFVSLFIDNIVPVQCNQNLNNVKTFTLGVLISIGAGSYYMVYGNYFDTQQKQCASGVFVNNFLDFLFLLKLI